MATTTHFVTLAPSPVPLRRVIVAASIGNALEWFDLVVYGFFATYISRAFFPTDDAAVSMLLAFGTFGISYLIRPVGAVFLGAYADRVGRKDSMLVSLALMMVGTVIIAVMPTYDAIGVAAPLGILFARLLQGFSAGGEFGSATALLVEHSPERRGFMSSWQFASQGLTTIIASLFGMILTTSLPPEQLDAWGWRIPFFFGLLIGPVGLYIRKFIHEGEEFRSVRPAKYPVRTLLATQKTRIAMAVGALAMSTAAGYLILYMPTYAARELHLSANAGFAATLASGIILTLVTPLVGHLSDRLGRLKIMTWAAIGYAVTIVPCFLLLSAFPTPGFLVMAMMWLGFLKASYFGALPALMAESFPLETRATGLALSYNIGTTIFGGFTPAVIAGLITITQSPSAPGLYLMACAALSLASIAIIRSRLGLR